MNYYGILCIFVSLMSVSFLQSISTVMSHRTISSSPLQYKQINYGQLAGSFEVEFWSAGMFDPTHTMANLGINGLSSFRLSQAGLGDVNSQLLLLATAGQNPDYYSSIDLKPNLMMYGQLIHGYKQFDYLFFDIKTALISCATSIKIQEIGSTVGGMQNSNNTPIYSALDAFTQSDWSYGKFGAEQKITGFDDIQFTIGSSTRMNSFSSDSCSSFIAGFGIVQIPTGVGTQANWLFEPQVGTNHWAFGFGVDGMVIADNGFSFIAGGNYRYIIKNWQTRSFDLTQNGQWSRYLALDRIALLGQQGPVAGLPGINLMTSDALIQGQNQLNLYARLQKQFSSCLFELSYNYFFTQSEKIEQVMSISSGYGVYDVATGGGVSTAHTATIAQRYPQLDAVPVMLKTTDLNVQSGAAGQWNSSTIAVRLQKIEKHYTYGIGASVDCAHSQQAISAWSAWLNVEIFIPN